MKPATHLLIIDPQNDFCDLPEARRPAGVAPALPVPGADADLRRLAALIRATGDHLDEITVTLDSHQRLDIAHRPSGSAPTARRSRRSPRSPRCSCAVASSHRATRRRCRAPSPTSTHSRPAAATR